MNSIIPCCVPYWDRRRFFAAGGQHSEQAGFHVREEAYLPDFEEWLPRKWQDRGNPPAPVILPDMLPTTAWAANLRTLYAQEEWDRLRRFCYQAAGNTCVACGSRGEPHVEAHEAWRFDETTGKQILVGLLCLCPTCHKIKHLGFANRLGRLPEVLERLCWLNEWSSTQLEQALLKAQKRQERLSTRQWELDLSFLKRYGVR